jgi:STE24 endopeptidase
MAKRILMIVMLLILGATSLWASPAIGDSALAKVASPETVAIGNDKMIIDTSKTSSQAESTYPVTPERRELLNKYSNFKLGWSVFYDILNWVILLAIVLTGISYGLLKLAQRISQKGIMQFLLYVFSIMFVTTFVTLPFDFYRDFIVEHQYGLSNQSFGGWLGDWAKAFPVSLIASAIIFGLMYFVIRRFPKRWWLWFSVGAIPVVILMMIIVPVVVAPIFNKFNPLPEGQLKTEILDLAGKAGIQGAKVFEVDASKQSKKLNAYVTGLFNTKRIVIYDTAIKAMTTEQLLFVVGHEMGHYVLHHVWIGTGMIILLIFFCSWLIFNILPAFIRKYQHRLGFDDISSYASLPLIILAFSMIAFFIQPVMNSASRTFEHQADKYGIRMTNYNSEAASVAFDKLSAYNLSDPNPSPLVEFWFYDHPALQKRIDFVKSYKGQ